MNAVSGLTHRTFARDLASVGRIGWLGRTDLTGSRRPIALTGNCRGFRTESFRECRDLGVGLGTELPLE
jgi:hypothetical protein